MRCARDVHGRGKRAQRFRASSFFVIRGVLTSKGASVRPTDVAKHIPARRDVEQSESISGRFPPFDGAQGAGARVEGRLAEVGLRRTRRQCVGSRSANSRRRC
jgi:hypothetical protein